jgi:hypothetical protein
MIYLQIWTSKSYETFIDKSRLFYVSSAVGITSIAALVWELWKSQDDIAVLSETWSSFCGAQFSTKLCLESGKVFYTKVVEDLNSFPAV